MILMIMMMINKRNINLIKKLNLIKINNLKINYYIFHKLKKNYLYQKKIFPNSNMKTLIKKNKIFSKKNFLIHFKNILLIVLKNLKLMRLIIKDD